MVQAARSAMGLPKTQLAAKAGISRNTLQQLEAGLGNVELKTLIAVCEVLGLDIVLTPKEISAKTQASFFSGQYKIPHPVGKPVRAAEPALAKKTSTFLSRLIKDKESIATGNMNRMSVHVKDGSKKDKK
jgi:transcriptional regulator with XRE-family HTH domain